MSEKYHDYVFKKGKFMGKFEEMYQNEKLMGYCSWFQNDLRDYGYLMSLAILHKYNFDRILDIGCGEGLFTSLLKKCNNEVIGIDASKTATNTARGCYKDIEFQTFSITGENFHEVFCVYKVDFDLILFKEVLSYMKDWKDILRQAQYHTEYVFISLDLPDHPVGFVKSFGELMREFRKHYDVIVKVKIETKGNQMLILGSVKNAKI